MDKAPTKSRDLNNIKLIREWEQKNVPKTAIDEKFKKYKNYYAPKKIVKNSTRVLSFGVGNDVRFEKLLYSDNNNLEIKLYDPTPLTVKFLGDNVRWPHFTFYPIAYSPTNGIQKFYFPKYIPRIVKEKKGRGSFSLKKHPNWANNFNFVNVNCKNLETIMQELSWQYVDIIKADIEGMWWEFCNELLNKNIDFKVLITEFELNFEDLSTSLEKAKTLCDKFKQNYNVYINKKREKLILELIFIRKDIDGR
jgi:hypothetical protein